MTEYDFSPQAYERHLATQTRIAHWVDDTNEHSPANPFLPLPGEHGAVQNSHPQLPQQTATSPSYDTIRHGPLSPSYTSHSSGSSKPKRSHKSKHGSKSFQPSPQLGVMTVPLGGGLYTTASQAQLAHPMVAGPPSVSKSYSTPQNPMYYYATPPFVPSMTGSMQMQQTSPPQQLQSHVYSPGYPYQYSPPPLSYCDSPPGNVHSISQPTTYAGSVRSLPLSLTPSSGSVSYIQPHPHQPIVIPLGDGGKNGYVVVPAAGQQVQVIVRHLYYYLLFIISHSLFCLQSPQYHAHYPRPGEESEDSDEEHASQSFFGSLGLGKKAKSASRKEHKKRKNKTCV